MRVLSIGECMAELAPAEKAGDFHLGYAGDTYNTAWYLAQIAPQTDVSYFTAVGQDAISQGLLDHIAASGIDASRVQRRADKTIGLYLISLDQGERSFSYWRGQSAAKTLADDPAALAKAIDSAGLIYFSGITLAILSDGARTTLLDALRQAKQGGKIVAFDPNLRPKLWASGSEMTETIMQGASVATVALPSFEDEASWFDDASPKATATRYAKAGATTVVVKNGEAAVRYLDGDTSGQVAVNPVAQVIDTTAAGDSFNAAILAGLAEGRPLERSIVQACALAGQVVQAKGALVAVS